MVYKGDDINIDTDVDEGVDLDIVVNVDVDVDVDVDIDVDIDVKVSDALVEEDINQLTSEISEDELKTLGQSGTLDFS